MNKFQVFLNPEDLASAMAAQVSYNDLIEFVKALDEYVADSEFTDQLKNMVEDL